MIAGYRDCFATDLTELGKCDVYKLRIDTGNAKPVAQRYYKCTPEKRQEIARQIEEMQAQGIIQRSSSEWASPVVLVKKKCGDLRFATDFRKLNAITHPITHPMPTLQDVFDAIGEAQPSFFSTLDLASGFWQLE